MLLAGEELTPRERPPLATSDETIRQRTGRGWEEWFDLLDEWGATEWSHREVARRVAAELGIDPLAWNAQAVTASYERARGLRVDGQRSDGFAVTAQRTVAVPVERLFDMFVDGSLRRRWLSENELRERTSSKPKSARFDWAGGDTTRVNVTFLDKGDGSSTVAVEHARLADAREAERMKRFWRERLATLKSQLEGGGIDA
ncbi:MAG: hypothetical protein M3454_02590 [Actinomycetota bacterium]|nr:hypothetical protein [Actinomycetota bacterium]